MTEYGDFVYEWFYDEEQEQFNCVGQVFLLAVVHSEADDKHIGILWDNEPVDPLWESEEEESPVIAVMSFNSVNEALDWCEAKDMQEAEFDAGAFGRAE